MAVTSPNPCPDPPTNNSIPNKKKKNLFNQSTPFIFFIYSAINRAHQFGPVSCRIFILMITNDLKMLKFLVIIKKFAGPGFIVAGAAIFTPFLLNSSLLA
jgi:hypothetical protein